jgi:hypothetical protein
MRQHVLPLLALSGFLLLAVQVNGQDQDSSDKAWPSLGSSEQGSSEQFLYDDRPRFMIESHKLKPAPDKSIPEWLRHCPPSTDGCVWWIRAGDFFSEWKGDMRRSTLRPGVVMHHYPYASFDGHFRGTGTYVFYLPERQIFYLWGDCHMGHADLGQGPFAGDPRVVLKGLAEDPDSIAQLGFLIVPFQTHGQAQASTAEAWPTIPRPGIDVTKLEKAENVFNPLSLERCRASSEKCVVSVNDFSAARKNQSTPYNRVLRSDVIAHYYRGEVDQYVFYLPRPNVFYVAGHGSSTPAYDVWGPFVGDPRVVLKKLAEGATAK